MPNRHRLERPSQKSCGVYVGHSRSYREFKDLADNVFDPLGRGGVALGLDLTAQPENVLCCDIRYEPVLQGGEDIICQLVPNGADITRRPALKADLFPLLYYVGEALRLPLGLLLLPLALGLGAVAFEALDLDFITLYPRIL